METNSTVVDLDAVTRQASVSIPSTVVDSEYGRAIEQATRSARIKGFREGKAPRHMVEQMQGDKVRWDVVSRLVSASLEDILKKNELQMVGSPKIDIKTMEAGKDLEFSADFSVYPTPEVKGYDKFEVAVPKATIGDDQVNEVIRQIRESKATIKKIEGRDTAAKGDVIEILFSVSLNGGEFSTPEPASVGLGEGRLPEELENSLLGIKIGETREVSGKIPENHQDAELRGKDAVYKVTLNGISEKVLPELDDDLVATLTFEAKTVLELRLEISRKLEEEGIKEAKEAARAKILDELLKANDFLVPQPLVDDEIRQLLVRAGAVDPSKMKMDEFPVDGLRDKFGDMAVRRVKTAIAVDRIAVQEKIAPTDEDVKSHIKDLAQHYGITEQEARKAFSERGALMNLAVEITRNKVLDVLLERAKITYVDPSEYKEESEGEAGGDSEPKKTKKKGKATKGE